MTYIIMERKKEENTLERNGKEAIRGESYVYAAWPFKIKRTPCPNPQP